MSSNFNGTAPPGPTPGAPSSPPPGPGPMPPMPPRMRINFSALLGRWWRGLFGEHAGAAPTGAAGTQQASQASASGMSRLRERIADFDEDYRNMGERLLGAVQQCAGYLVPFVMVVAVGSDLGAYFTPYMGAFSANLVAYAMEITIAALTIAMGRAFEHIASGHPQYLKLCLTVCGWGLLNTSTALGLYVLSSDAPSNSTPMGHLMLVVRVAAIALVDLGCSFALMWRGKSMQKHIEGIHRKVTAMGALADAERAMEEADKNAVLREKMMLSTLKIQEDLSEKIGAAVSMVMGTILTKMEASLNNDGPGTGRDKPYGKK